MPDVLVVDRQGLARKIARRPKAFILYELLQNSWDENVTRVIATAKMLPGRPVCHITVEDDCPEGFEDMRSIYTMFRDSKKAPDPTKRGRFELGEKMVIALAQEATISTTKGTVVICGNERKRSSKKRDAGTLFEATFKMTREEYDQMIRDVFKVMPSVPTWINGEAIPVRKLLATFEATLPTIISNAEGVLSNTTRKTVVNIVEPAKDEPAMIYEMGLPIAETGDRWHYDVMQRVPLNWERDNVTPSYLKTLRVFVLNKMHNEISPDEATNAWVRDASADKRCEQEAFQDVLTKRFGDKVVVRDPTDPESAARAMAAGYEVLSGRTLSAGEWANAKQFGVIPASSKEFPTSKPYSDNPNAEPVKIVPPSKYTDGMRQVVEYTKNVGSKLIGKPVYVEIVNTTNNFSAAFMPGSTELHYNIRHLGKKWFEQGITEEVLSLMLHELAHNHESNHLSDRYTKEVCRLAGKLVKMIATDSELLAITK